jgi:phosphatidylglycerol:prolipoprotein diacylglycerol transferase
MHGFLATYVHHLDPIAIHFTESFGIRWYGLAYVAGFLIAYFLLCWFVKLKVSELKKDQVADFITAVAVVGVMLGGRFGYMLFYNWDAFSRNPAIFFDFLGGGMSSHGAFAGLILAVWGYAKFTKKSFLGLGDNLVCVAPAGVFLGRLANFINGELYGRETTFTMGMKFPEELNHVVESPNGRYLKYSIENFREITANAGEILPDLTNKFEAVIAQAQSAGRFPHAAAAELLINTSRENSDFRAILAEYLTVRHPSQIYQALVEGFAIFVLLMAIRLKWRHLYQGVLSGIFFFVYGIGRILVENYREPDSELIGAMSKGQFYSIFMIGMGVVFLVYAFVTKRRNMLTSC